MKYGQVREKTALRQSLYLKLPNSVYGVGNLPWNQNCIPYTSSVVVIIYCICLPITKDYMQLVIYNLLVAIFLKKPCLHTL